MIDANIASQKQAVASTQTEYNAFLSVMFQIVDWPLTLSNFDWEEVLFISTQSLIHVG